MLQLHSLKPLGTAIAAVAENCLFVLSNLKIIPVAICTNGYVILMLGKVSLKKEIFLQDDEGYSISSWLKTISLHEIIWWYHWVYICVVSEDDVMIWTNKHRVGWGWGVGLGAWCVWYAGTDLQVNLWPDSPTFGIVITSIYTVHECFKYGRHEVTE